MASWSPSSWRALPKHQMAEWEDKALAEKVLTKLGKLPGLVQPKECDRAESPGELAGWRAGAQAHGERCQSTRWPSGRTRLWPRRSSRS
mmetsp:Transcript_26003/g.62000  ORF Transcript_26003/g.62000 Transcript_26003/m.62000 type:complete len:89 (-) Transcript_26003:42-308(-)